MATCTGITRSGKRCKGVARDSSGYCHAHHPARAEERKHNARKGGKSGGRGRGGGTVSEVAALKEQLADLAGDVRNGAVDRGDAVAINQILNTMLRCIELERKRNAGGLITVEENIEQMHMIFEVVQRYVPPSRLKDLRDDFDALLPAGG